MKIKIGAHHVQVIYIKKVDEEDSTGKCDRDNNTIYIKEGIADSQKEQTLLHEIIHFINSEIDEVTTEFLAHTIHQVIKGNNLWD